MGVQLIGRMKDSAGAQDRYLADWARQRWRYRQRQGQVPDRLAELRLMQPRIPRAKQRAVLRDGLKTLKVLLDAGFHVFVQRPLFGGEVGGRDQGQTHRMSPWGMAIGRRDNPERM